MQKENKSNTQCGLYPEDILNTIRYDNDIDAIKNMLEEHGYKLTEEQPLSGANPDKYQTFVLINEEDSIPTSIIYMDTERKNADSKCTRFKLTNNNFDDKGNCITSDTYEFSVKKAEFAIIDLEAKNILSHTHEDNSSGDFFTKVHLNYGLDNEELIYHSLNYGPTGLENEYVRSSKFMNVFPLFLEIGGGFDRIVRLVNHINQSEAKDKADKIRIFGNRQNGGSFPTPGDSM